MNDLNLLVTGGAGFIGSALVRYLIKHTQYKVIVLDKLTYAGNLESLKDIEHSDRFRFFQGDINDRALVKRLLNDFQPRGVLHLAAESHVDRSIDGPATFIETNILGTFNLLECSLEYWQSINKDKNFRFQHISTDEVFGSLGPEGLFTETTRYEPNSPYSASKAASDHLVHAWNKTYGLPILMTNCSNNYGPYHYPEKLIPLVILKALQGKPLPIYGDGKQIRDWLYVDDHVKALLNVFEKGKVGETYNIGGDSEKTNIDVVKQICTYLDEMVPASPYRPHSQLIIFVKDRPGHDVRYAIDTSKIKSELGWRQDHNFENGLKETIEWFLFNNDWVESVSQKKYHGERLGVRE